MSGHQRRSLWPSSTTLLYRPSLPVGLQGYILYWHRAVVCWFSLVVLPLREWQRAWSNVSVLDLRKTYLQVCVHQSLWSYWTVLFKERRYCLTRMGFGLNVALSIMQTIVDAILMKNKSIQRATSAYIDYVYVYESIVPAACVKEHLCSFGLLSKEPERLQDGVQVLRLQAWGEDNSLYWRKRNKIPDMPRVVTRRNIFSLCGKLVGWLALYSCGVHQAESIWRHRWMGWQNWWRPSQHHDYTSSHQSTQRRPGEGQMMRQQPSPQHMGQRKHSCYRHVTCIWWGCSRGCLLVMSRKGLPTY